MKRDVSPDREKGRSHEEAPGHRGRHDPFFIVFTDLDGTLLDHETYEWKEAAPALSRCRERHIPVILISSKTRAEIDRLRQEMGLVDPFVSENGGGVFFPKEGTPQPPQGASSEQGLWKWSLGPSHDILVRALGEIREERAWALRGFSDMGPEEISRLTGLDLYSASLASLREFDEPFLVPEEVAPDISLLHEAAERKGLQVTRGGRFFHLHGRVDKGDAMDRLISWYRGFRPSVRTIGLGDSPNDFSMLLRVDHPVLVRSARAYPELETRLPSLMKTREKGPRGWNRAVLRLLGHSSSKGDSLDV